MIVWFLTGNVIANPISVDDAMLKAKKFLSSNTAKRIKGNINLSLAYSMTDSLSTIAEEPVLYAFNINDGNGFVIVSGDDVAVPVLGYSDNGSFNADSIPLNMKAWLNNYADEIAWAKTKASNNENKDLLIPKKAKTTISALVPSRWNQLSPYCDQCVFNGKSYATGCVATAMAQIMYYWAVKGVDGETFPCGSKALPSYTTFSGVTIDALDKVDSFDWSNMTNDLITPSVTSANKAAVAKLMRYCGQSIKTDYDYNGSAANDSQVVQALIDCFGYNSDMLFVQDNMSTSAWKDLVYNQLSDGKPIMLSANSIGSDYGLVGHEFICDGYDASTDKYHFNWGWGGNWDGWYEMSSLNPSKYDFSGAKSAIIDIMPLGQPLGVKEYAVLSNDETTLTFYNDNLYGSREGTVYEINNTIQSNNWWETSTHQGWYGNGNITDVVFDRSFANARPISTSHWFEDLTGLVNIYNIENLNTSNVNDMSRMFANCCELESIDFGFDTSNVTDMSGMFSNCYNLGYAPLSYFHTENVINMSGMFYACYNLPLEYCGIGAFNTSNVTDMSDMFAYCFISPEGLRSLDLDFICFDTSCVTNMSGMFEGGDAISSINLSSFNTSKVTDMSYIFSGCSILSDIDLSNFDTSNVTDMGYMFSDCCNLSNLDVSNFNTSKVSNMNGMFSYCSGIADLDVRNFDTSNVTDMSNMFSDCCNLSNLDVSNFNTSKVSNMSGMFSYCSGITELDLSNFDTSVLTDLSYMFSGCSGLNHIDVSNFETSKVTDMSSLFSGCIGLSELNVSSFDMSKAPSSRYIFTNCKNIKTLYIPASISSLSNSDFCKGVGTESNPCKIFAPDDFDFGVDVSGDYFQWKKGYFTIGKVSLLGDVNHDNEVNISDVVLTVDYVLGKENSNFYYENADTNSDEMIDISDVVGIVNIVLGNSSAYTTSKKHYLKAIDNIYVSRNYDGIGIGLYDSNQYIACQFTVKLPEGCSLKKVTLDEDCSNGHSLTWNYLGNRTYKVLAFSFDGIPFVNNDTSLFNMNINGRDNERIEITDILFVNQAFEGVVYDDVRGVPTSIVNVRNENDDLPIYNLQGMKVDNPSNKGLYIKDGKKVSIMR